MRKGKFTCMTWDNCGDCPFEKIGCAVADKFETFDEVYEKLKKEVEKIGEELDELEEEDYSE